MNRLAGIMSAGLFLSIFVLGCEKGPEELAEDALSAHLAEKEKGVEILEFKTINVEKTAMLGIPIANVRYTAEIGRMYSSGDWPAFTGTVVGTVEVLKRDGEWGDPTITRFYLLKEGEDVSTFDDW